MSEYYSNNVRSITNFICTTDGNCPEHC